VDVGAARGVRDRRLPVVDVDAHLGAGGDEARDGRLGAAEGEVVGLVELPARTERVRQQDEESARRPSSTSRCEGEERTATTILRKGRARQVADSSREGGGRARTYQRSTVVLL